MALGLRAAGLLAMRTGRYSAEEHLRVLATMALLGMPLRTSVDAAAAFDAMQSDKKKRKGKLRFVLPRAIGDVEYGVEVPDRQVRARARANPADARISGINASVRPRVVDVFVAIRSSRFDLPLTYDAGDLALHDR